MSLSRFSWPVQYSGGMFQRDIDRRLVGQHVGHVLVGWGEGRRRLVIVRAGTHEGVIAWERPHRGGSC